MYGLIITLGASLGLIFSDESTHKVCTNIEIRKVGASVSCFIWLYKELLIIEVARWVSY